MREPGKPSRLRSAAARRTSLALLLLTVSPALADPPAAEAPVRQNPFCEPNVERRPKVQFATDRETPEQRLKSIGRVIGLHSVGEGDPNEDPSILIETSDAKIQTNPLIRSRHLDRQLVETEVTEPTKLDPAKPDPAKPEQAPSSRDHSILEPTASIVRPARRSIKAVAKKTTDPKDTSIVVAATAKEWVDEGERSRVVEAKTPRSVIEAATPPETKSGESVAKSSANPQVESFPALHVATEMPETEAAADSSVEDSGLTKLATDDQPIMFSISDDSQSFPEPPKAQPKNETAAPTIAALKKDDDPRVLGDQRIAAATEVQPKPEPSLDSAEDAAPVPLASAQAILTNKRHRMPVAVTPVPIQVERISADVVEPTVQTAISFDPTGRPTRGPNEPIPLHLAQHQIGALNLGGRLQDIEVQDSKVCQAVAIGPGQLKLIASGEGITRLVVWATDMAETVPAQSRTFEVHVSARARQAVPVTGYAGPETASSEEARANGDTNAPTPAAPSNSGSADGRTGNSLAELNRTIASQFPDSDVAVQRTGDSITVYGRCVTTKSARRILRLVRKAYLIPVKDEIVVP